MKRLRWTVLLVGVFAAFAVIDSRAQSSFDGCGSAAALGVQTSDQAGHIVAIECSNGSYQVLSSGSAARISETEWLTARHVMDTHGREARLYLVDTEGEAHLIEHWRVHEHQDLARFELNEDAAGAILPQAPALRAGEQMLAFGPNRKHTQIQLLGRSQAAEYDGPESVEVLEFDAEVAHGYSGGPILNAQGQLIAITFAVRTDVAHTIAVPLSAAEDIE